MRGLNVYMKTSFGVWNADLKYDYIALQRVACLSGYNFVIHSTCHTPKESSILLFVFGKALCFTLCNPWDK